MQVIQTDAVIIYGIVSEIDFVTPAGYPAGSLFVDEQTGMEYSVGTDTFWFPRNAQTSGGLGAMSMVSTPWVIWSTADAVGPTLNYGTIGINKGGIPSSDLYINMPGTDIWLPTTQTLAGFFGK